MKTKILFCVFFALGFNLALISPALAIPSPDVVVGLFASSAQVLVLLTAMLGGAGLVQRRNSLLVEKSANNSGFLQKRLLNVVLVLLLLSLGANLLQYTHWLDAQNTRLQANLVRSSTEEGKKVGDVSLKTLSFSEQLKHPRGISTEELARKLAESDNPGTEKINVIDVRESEEVEMGGIKGSHQIHYPNVLRNPESVIKEGQETILFCHSGNRSSELCDKLTALGIPCKFVIGGYEKWVAEDRPLESINPGVRKDIRAIADYPNKKVLLETAKVQRLVKEEKAVFVDVRYPGDFELGHLPGAINIPLRKLTQEEMLAQLQELPKQPIIAPCYDKRSCFYSMILGLRLHRLGYDFRGRYTVPHEYSAPQAEKTYIQKWQANNDSTLLGRISTPLGQMLLWLNSKVGHLTLAILFSVSLLRLGTFPLTFKGERDQILLRSLSPKIAELKEKIGNDQQRFSRALLALYRQHRLTPTLNLLGSLVQILVFLLLFRAVSRVAQTSNDSFLWISQLSSHDPLFLLPLLLGGLTFLHLQLTASKPRHIPFLILRCLAGILLFSITFKLAAAVNLYLVFSVTFMMLQHQVVTRILDRREQPRQVSSLLLPTSVVTLQLAHQVPGTGNKAARLGQLMASGLPVPDGFVIPAPLLAQSQARLALSEADWKQIKLLWRKLKAERVAVRSSGANEDGSVQSYAGVFTSVLNVKWENFYDALGEVYHSWESKRVTSYSNGKSEASGGILVQEMVDAEFAGVLFTQHPADQSTLLVEVIPGLAEDLVSGKVTPKAYRFGRFSTQLLDSEAPPIDLTPLIKLGQQAEKLFGQPQDIEWAYRAGRFLFLQSRNITAPLGLTESENDRKDLFEREKQRLLELAAGAKSDEVVFVQNELSELLPQPTPLSLSLMEALWQAGGTTDLACRALGLPYDVLEDAPSFVSSVFGTLYINRREEKKRLRQSVDIIASLRLTRTVDSLEQQYRQEFLSAFLRQVRLKESINFSQLKTEELFELFEEWRCHFTQETYVQAHLINIAADFCLKLAERELKRRNLNPATYLSQMPETVVHQAMSLLSEIRTGKTPVSEFLKLFGHRALYDFELAQPRYSEEPELVEKLLTTALPHSPKTRSQMPELPSSKILAVAVERARKFQSLKEEAKHHSLRELALLRQLLLELGQRLEIGEGIFYYTLAELPLLRDRAYRQQTDARKAEYRAKIGFFQSLRLPSQLTLSQIESLSLTADSEVRISPTSSKVLQGTLVAGQAPVQGRAQIIVNAEDIGNFQKGNILVTRFTHPGWIPIFPQAGAVITEVGGWLSHAAIVAREYNVTTIVGVQGALDKIDTGDLLQLNSDGTIEHL